MTLQPGLDENKYKESYRETLEVQTSKTCQ